jgi:outer membrane protein OmpA-like peptidoglycan-associated protein
MIKKLQLLTLFCLAYFTQANAQYLLGISNSNYAGTNGVFMNPSSIADSRHGFYLNFATFDAHLTNNYAQIGPIRKFLDQKVEELNEGEKFTLDSPYLEQRLDGKPKMFSAGADLRGPSLMIKMSPKHSFAITTRSRLSVQGYDISEDLARLLTYGADNSALQNVANNNSGFTYMRNSFAEVGLTYGRSIIESNAHYLKGGFTLKRLIGIYSAYAFNDDFDYSLRKDPDGEVYVQVENLDARYGYTSGSPVYFDRNVLNKWGKGSWGFDLGFTYEFRPKFADYRYTMDGKERGDGKENKYMFKVAMALVDIGNVKYTNPDLREYRIKRNNFRFDSETLSLDNASDLDEVLFETFTPELQKRTTYLSGLPTALNVNLDYRMANKLYLNMTWIQSMKSTDKIAMRSNSLIALAPRVELKGFEFSIPVSLQNNYKSTAIGAMMRLGPLFFGSDNLKGLVFKKSDGFNLYMGFALPISAGKKADKDNDGVSDAQDACKTVPGKWEFKGCPDSDDDGVADSEDACPAEAGLKEFGGCPDTDGDGVVNAKDNCPTDAGLPQFNGCPDKDGDGVMDKEDKCPEDAGLVSFRGCPDRDDDGVQDSEDACPEAKGLPRFRGCPDTDNDGIPDSEDACPEVKGPVALKGCPDRDSDGINDMEDRCPDTAGLVKFKGCPDDDGDGVADIDDACPDVTGSVAMKGCPDRDNDGVSDKEDKCPDVFGSVTNNGCPLAVAKMKAVELSTEEANVVKEAFDNLEFETGKAAIKIKSLGSLKELADLLNAKAEYRLLVSGHTDNVGDATANIKLSKARADAVKKYLTGVAGVVPDKIITEGFGAKKPIASNTTEEGRQKNRRVEMKIIK